eukprot:29974-Pelagococcus_subviridis.AAC.17
MGGERRAPGEKVLKERRPPRERGRTGTGVNANAPSRTHVPVRGRRREHDEPVRREVRERARVPRRPVVPPDRERDDRERAAMRAGARVDRGDRFERQRAHAPRPRAAAVAVVVERDVVRVDLVRSRRAEVLARRAG